MQSWSPSLHPASKLSKDIIQLLKTGQKLGVSFDALKLSESLKEQLPAWYHLGANQKILSLNNHKASKCLRGNHLVKTIGDLVQVTKCERDMSITHKHLNRSNCACQYCKYDRQHYSCAAPNKCSLVARKLLDQLQAKWDPRNKPPVDGLTHTPNRKLANMAAYANMSKILFDPSVTSDNDLSHNFRVFTDQDAKCADPGYRRHPLVAEHAEETTAHTAGSCVENGYDNAQAGSGVWFGPDDPRNVALKIPGPIQSKQAGHLAAVLYVVKATPPFAPLHIVSSSKYIIDCFTRKFTAWEEQGWIGIPNMNLIKPIISHLRARGAITSFTKASELARLENANKLADEGSCKESYDILDLKPDHKFNLTGAQLSTMSQAVVYQGIQEET